MSKSLFADWLEKKYLNWQIENGRASVRDFSEWLGINHALIVQWMNDKAKPGPKTLPLVAGKLGNEAYDLLGINRPDPGLQLIIRNWDKLPESFKQQLLQEIEHYENRGGESPFANERI